MAYATLEQVRAYIEVDDPLNDIHDELIEGFIDRAKAIIDRYTGYTFEAESDTSRTFDACANVDGRELIFGGDMCASITSITNGDGTTITSSQYVTEPRNVTPHYAVTLLRSSGVVWTYSTDPENAITVTGRWAYMVTPSDDIVQACIRLASWLYRQRDTNADADRPLLTGDGNVIFPSAIPNDVKAYINHYRNRT